MARLFAGPPSEYWPMDPSVRTTRWQGTMSGTGLWPSAVPTRPDRLGPADLGGDPAVWPDFTARDLEGLRPDVPLEVGVAAKVEIDPDAAVAAEAAFDGRAKRRRQLGRVDRTSGPRDVLGLERGVVASRLHGGHPEAVPGHDQGPDRRVHPGEPIGEADLDQDARSEGGRGVRHQVGQCRLQGAVIDGHAVISSGCRRCADS